jgi:spermidine synthase
VVSVTVERLTTPRGELVLRRDGEHHEIVSNGVFLMDTRDGRSERELVRAALRSAPAGSRVLIGGLGVGFSLAEALRSPGVARVTVVEIEPAVVRWNRTHFGGHLDDPRVTVLVEDLGAWLPTGDDEYDAVCLDVDNGPEWTVMDSNAALYGDRGLDAVDRRLAPGGTLAVWSAAAVPAFEARLRRRYSSVDVVEIPVPRGEPDVIYAARSPLPA